MELKENKIMSICHIFTFKISEVIMENVEFINMIDVGAESISALFIYQNRRGRPTCLPLGCMNNIGVMGRNRFCPYGFK